MCTIDASTATASITQKAMTQKPIRSCTRTTSAQLPDNASSDFSGALGSLSQGSISVRLPTSILDPQCVENQVAGARPFKTAWL